MIDLSSLLPFYIPLYSNFLRSDTILSSIVFFCTLLNTRNIDDVTRDVIVRAINNSTKEKPLIYLFLI